MDRRKGWCLCSSVVPAAVQMLTTWIKVGEVEAIPDKIENKWDNAVDDVEAIPEDAAEWAGRKVGEVEQFGDNMDDAYDEGRAEGRDDW